MKPGDLVIISSDVHAGESYIGLYLGFTEDLETPDPSRPPRFLTMSRFLTENGIMDFTDEMCDYEVIK